MGVAALSVGVAARSVTACSGAACSGAASEIQSSGVAGVEVVYGGCSSISDAICFEAVSLRWMALSGMRRKKRNGPVLGMTSSPWACGLGLSTVETSQVIPFPSSWLSPKLDGVVTTASDLRACQPSDHHGCKVPLEIAHPSRTTSTVFLSHCTVFAEFSDFLSKA